MEIGTWPSCNGVDDTFREVRRHGLVENLAELDTFGFTILPGEQLGTPELFDRLRAALLRVIEERTGIEHTVDTEPVQVGKLKTTITYPNQLVLFYLLVEDAAFRDAVTHPVLRPLVEMVLGPTYQIYSCAAFAKSKGDAYGGYLLHTDSASFPDPLPAPRSAHVVNTNWLLTDYTRANGPLCVVPGSHHWRRQPKPGEADDLVIPVEAPAGSVILFHGNLWHGGMPKETDGLRLSLNCSFSRAYAKTQEDYRGVFPKDVLDEHGEYFARLVGEDDAMGWKSAEGPDAAKFFKRVKL